MGGKCSSLDRKITKMDERGTMRADREGERERGMERQEEPLASLVPKSKVGTHHHSRHPNPTVRGRQSNETGCGVARRRLSASGQA